MKKLLLLAALLGAAALAQASVQRPTRACPQNATNAAGPSAPQLAGGGGCRGQNNGRSGRSNSRGSQRGDRTRRGQRGSQGRRGQGGGQGFAAFTPGAGATGNGSAGSPPPNLQTYVDTLQSTLERELYARDYYQAADLALAGPRRFGNISNAEQQHADMVAGMITYLGGTPVMSHDYPVIAPSTILEADNTCMRIELLVIGVYKDLIRDCPDPALLPTLNGIQASNYQHLSVVGG